MAHQACIPLLERAVEVAVLNLDQLRDFDSAAPKYFQCLGFDKAKVKHANISVLLCIDFSQLVELSAALQRLHRANERSPWPLFETQPSQHQQRMEIWVFGKD